MRNPWVVVWVDCLPGLAWGAHSVGWYPNLNSSAHTCSSSHLMGSKQEFIWLFPELFLFQLFSLTGLSRSPSHGASEMTLIQQPYEPDIPVFLETASMPGWCSHFVLWGINWLLLKSEGKAISESLPAAPGKWAGHVFGRLCSSLAGF